MSCSSSSLRAPGLHSQGPHLPTLARASTRGAASRLQKCANYLGTNLVHPTQLSISALTHMSLLCPGLPSVRETVLCAKHLGLSEGMLLKALTSCKNATEREAKEGTSLAHRRQGKPWCELSHRKG